MKISKATAQEVAKKLLAEKTKAAESKLLDFREEFTKKIEEKIPALIKETQQKHPEFFSTIRTVYMNFTGSYESVSLTRTVISFASGEGKPNKEDMPYLLSLRLEWLNAKDRCQNLYDETVQAILSLGTDTRLKESFPEAYALLPQKQYEVPAVNFQSLINKLKSSAY